MEGCLKRGFGQFADLRVVEGGEGGGGVDTPMHTMAFDDINK